MAEVVRDWAQQGSASRRVSAAGVVALDRRPFPLTHGGVLPQVSVAYHLVGPAGAPVVAVLGGISATRYVTRAPTGVAAWWGELFGPGKAVDTKRWRVLSYDFLGGNGATTGPRCAGYERQLFAEVSTQDQAQVLAELLAVLRIPRLHALVGASYGGMVGLAFAHAYPELLRHLCVISAAHKSAPMGIAWRTIQRQIVELGLGTGRGAEALSLARSLAMATYRTPEEFAARFAGERLDAASPDSFPVWNYLRARGDDYIRHMDPYAFLCLSRSIDLHAVAVAKQAVPLTLVGVRQDQLVPLPLVEELAAAYGEQCQLHVLSSLYGHDAFLKEPVFFANLFAQL